MTTNNHYIYAHFDQNEPVYIGVGHYGRAWQCDGSAAREAKHGKWMQSQLPELNVQIIASNLTTKEAHNLERILISELNPKFNVRRSKHCYHNDKKYHNSFHAANLTGYNHNSIITWCGRKSNGWRWEHDNTPQYGDRR